MGGRPHSGWEDNIIQYTPRDFRTLGSVGFDGVEWVREFLLIRGLKELEVIPMIEHAPHPKSEAMLFFLAFSASIDKGFTEYLREEMLTDC
jgi:hypothetical protein